MTKIELKCPYCGADLSEDDGLDTFFCKYCGGKIVLDGISDEIVKAKVKSKEIDYKKYKIRSEMEEKDREYRRKVEQEWRDKKSTLFAMAMCVLVLFALAVAWRYF